MIRWIHDWWITWRVWRSWDAETRAIVKGPFNPDDYVEVFGPGGIEEYNEED